MRRRGLTLLISICITALVYMLYRDRIPRSLPLGRYGPTEEQIASGHNILPDLRTLRQGKLRLPKGLQFAPENVTSPYAIGETKPAGSTYTKTLVIASMKEENTTWVRPELEDMIEAGILTTAIYVVDDRKAKLHPPVNKGHEAMVYLTYIIDHYDKLSDVSIFMHAHQYTWHNNELSNLDAAMMVRQLSPQRVTRLGYMNLRCAFEPGCPAWIRPGTIDFDDDKQEQAIIAYHWPDLFPGEAIPQVLAQACCAQFAVSRERILALPRARYVAMRKWLLDTHLDDYLSGRIFEYTWQYIFSLAPIDCPDMAACYCDGYGICFGDERKFDYWFELRYWLGEDKWALKKWWEKDDLVREYRRHSRDGRVDNLAADMIPEPGLDAILEANITKTWAAMKELRDAAIALGENPRQRALESGREWHEGDGY